MIGTFGCIYFRLLRKWACPASFLSRAKGGEMLTGKELKLYNALAPYANDKGVEIVTVEVVGSKKSTYYSYLH